MSTNSASTSEQHASAGVREQKKRALRQRIMDVSISHFERSGYDGTTVDDICFDMGISKATFFRYFPTKDAVLREFANNKMEKYIATDVEGSVQSARIQFERLMERLNASCAQYTKLVVAIVESGGLDPVRYAHAKDVRSLTHRVLLTMLATGQREGNVRGDIDAETLAQHLWTVCYTALAVWARSTTRSGPPMTSDIASVFFDGAAGNPLRA